MIRTKIVKLLLALGITGLTLGFLGEFFWLFDLLSHFRVYFLFYFVFILCILLAQKNWKLVFVSTLFLSYCLLSISHFYLPTKKEVVHKSQKIISINLLSHNDNYESVSNFIANENPDIILLQELNETWVHGLHSILLKYPYQLLEPRWDNFGIGILSKKPGVFEIRNFGMAGVPSVIFTTQHESEIIQIIGTHPLPPISSDYTFLRNVQIEEVGQFIANSPFETILIGDLNTSSFSTIFKKLMTESSLTDSRKSFGIQPSWNSMMPWLKVAIDHAMVTEKIKIKDRRLGPNIGSDHLPVILEFGIKTDD